MKALKCVVVTPEMAAWMEANGPVQPNIPGTLLLGIAEQQFPYVLRPDPNSRPDPPRVRRGPEFSLSIWGGFFIRHKYEREHWNFEDARKEAMRIYALLDEDGISREAHVAIVYGPGCGHVKPVRS